MKKMNIQHFILGFLTTYFSEVSDPPPERSAAGQLSKKAWPVTSPNRPNLKPATLRTGEGMKGKINDTPGMKKFFEE